ncbi:MAG: hypothetical protein CSB24_00775 [Deltaproteobacteria bacterium]|nr:MAG: hypothetical protein CSB24_00775 [Deltaproteobacteria bacterium]
MEKPTRSYLQQKIVDLLKDGCPEFASVSKQEELDEALKTTLLLPAAVVIYAGDYPARLANGNQALKRYWSIVLVLDLQDDPARGLDLIDKVEDTMLGVWLSVGTGQISLAGTKFITAFDQTRTIYEVRLMQDAWLNYDNQ